MDQMNINNIIQSLSKEQKQKLKIKNVYYSQRHVEQTSSL